MKYGLGLVLGFVVALGLVPVVIHYAVRFGAVDQVSQQKRKIHKKPIPRAGGVAIFLSFVLICTVLLPHLSYRFIGLVLAGLIVLLVGLYDDIRGLSPWVKLVFQLLAALVVVLGFGINVESITNPLGGQFILNSHEPMIQLGQLQVNPGLVANLLAIVWLVGLTNTINLLDGLDGLSGGVSAIAAFIIFLLAISPTVNQPDTALIAVTLSGACLGYLVYNFYPAKVFNGDSGAYFLGMTLGILAIFSGAKLATAALVLGLPIFDAIWAFIRRLMSGHSPFQADRGHFHHLLIDVGLSQRQAVILIYGITALFGSLALIANSTQKFIAIGALLTIMILSVGLLTFIRRNLDSAKPKIDDQ